MESGTTLMWRERLVPGKATQWHVDPYDNVSAVLGGEGVAIEYDDGGAPHLLTRQVDRHEPAHRFIEASIRIPYPEGDHVFFLDRHGAEAEPSRR